VCTLCSCTLGKCWPSAVWYKAAPYRSRAVKDRAACSPISASACRRKPKSASGIRPPRPVFWCCRCARRHRGLERTATCRLVTRDSMIGTGFPKTRAHRHERRARHGGMDGFGKVDVEPNEPMFHTEWEARVLAMVRRWARPGLQHRYLALLSRVVAAACLSQQFLLQEMVFWDSRTCCSPRVLSARDVARVTRATGKTAQARQVRVDDVERIMVRGKFARTARRRQSSRLAIGYGRRTFIP